MGHLARRRPPAASPGVDLRQVPLLSRCAWRRHGERRLVYAFWGLKPPSTFDWVKEVYRQQLAIETTYRQLHQAQNPDDNRATRCGSCCTWGSR